MRRESWWLLLMLFSSSFAAATTYVVNPEGGGDFLSIQEAIEAVQTGDEILVAPATYLENIDYLGKDLAIRSIEGQQATIIDGSAGAPGVGSCATFQFGESSAAVLEGFTLTGGHGTELADDWGRGTRGGAVFCRQSSPTLRACRMTENSAESAGAIYVHQATLNLFDCEIDHNSVTSLGGAIAGSSWSVTIEDCDFEYNTAGWGGGAIHINPPVGIITGCTFLGNEADTGGALSVDGYGTGLEVASCLFAANQAWSSIGGAVRLHESSVSFSATVFAENWAATNGGGISAIDGAAPTMTGCTFYGNGADGCGGNLHLQDSATTQGVFNCLITAAAAGGGVCGGIAAVFLCCDTWGNAGGNYLGIPDPTGSAGNISADPLLCDAPAGDFSLAANSPCAPFSPPNSECDLIGASPVGCGGTPLNRTTWGAIKASFRR